MDGIIEVKVNGNSISKDNDCAGVQGESNSTVLRISFAENWDGYGKRIVFYDALGKNPVKIQLGTNLLEDILKDTRVYLVPIPSEAMTEAGYNSFVIQGEVDGIVKKTVEAKLKVLYSPYTGDANDPKDITPSEAAQLRTEMDAVLDDIAKAEEAKVRAAESARIAADEALNAGTKAGLASTCVEQAAEARDAAMEAEVGARQERERIENMTVSSSTLEAGAEATVNKDELNGVVHLAFGIPVGESGVYIGTEAPTDPNIKVWIDTNGEADASVLPVRAFVNILGGAESWFAEDVYDRNGSVVGVRYGQVVNVNNAVITPNSKVDLQISSEQMVIFYEKDLAFVAENDDGVVTVYCVGNVPENSYTLQATVTEVLTNA